MNAKRIMCCHYVHHEGSHAQGRHALAEGERGRIGDGLCVLHIHRKSRGSGRGEEEAAGRPSRLIILVIEPQSPEGGLSSLLEGACD